MNGSSSSSLHDSDLEEERPPSPSVQLAAAAAAQNVSRKRPHPVFDDEEEEEEAESAAQRERRYAPPPSADDDARHAMEEGEHEDRKSSPLSPRHFKAGKKRPALPPLPLVNDLHGNIPFPVPMMPPPSDPTQFSKPSSSNSKKAAKEQQQQQQTSEDPPSENEEEDASDSEEAIERRLENHCLLFSMSWLNTIYKEHIDAKSPPCYICYRFPTPKDNKPDAHAPAQKLLRAALNNIRSSHNIELHVQNVYNLHQEKFIEHMHKSGMEVVANQMIFTRYAIFCCLMRTLNNPEKLTDLNLMRRNALIQHYEMFKNHKLDPVTGKIYDVPEHIDQYMNLIEKQNNHLMKMQSAKDKF